VISRKLNDNSKLMSVSESTLVKSLSVYIRMHFCTNTRIPCSPIPPLRLVEKRSLEGEIHGIKVGMRERKRDFDVDMETPDGKLREFFKSIGNMCKKGDKGGDEASEKDGKESDKKDGKESDKGGKLIEKDGKVMTDKKDDGKDENTMKWHYEKGHHVKDEEGHYKHHQHQGGGEAKEASGGVGAIEGSHNTEDPVPPRTRGEKGCLLLNAYKLLLNDY
jgi:hypothetical protein